MKNGQTPSADKHQEIRSIAPKQLLKKTPKEKKVFKEKVLIPQILSHVSQVDQAIFHVTGSNCINFGDFKIM